MRELNEMLKRVKLDSIASYLIYGIGTEEEITENYEEKINESFNIFFERLKKLYPNIDKENDDLFAIVSDLTIAHDDTYFLLGTLIGFQMYKSMEDGYENLKDNGVHTILEDAKGLK